MIVIRPGNDQDRPRILSLLTDVFGADAAQRVADLWHWQWHLDPRLGEPGFQGRVAEWDGKIIGNVGMIPAGLYLKGRPVPAHWCVDMAVHWGLTRAALRDAKRAGRDRGLGNKGVAEAVLDAAGEGQIQLSKHVADKMLTIVYRIAYRDVPGGTGMHRRVSAHHPVARALGKGPATLLAPLASLGLPRIPKAGIPVTLLDGPFDARFDDLWHRVMPLYPAITLRDRTTLQWRYRQHPQTDYRVLTLEAGDGLRGYLVCSIYDRTGRRRGKIVDLLAAPRDRAAMDALVAGALGLMRDERVERVEAFASGPALADVFSLAGFAPRLSKSGGSQPLACRHLPTDTLYIGQGDGDGG